MSKILRYKEFSLTEKQSKEFLDNLLNPLINESADNRPSLVKKILKNLAGDLKFNLGLVGTFGMGIAAMLPVVQNLVENSALSIEVTPENMVLLTLCVLSITYLEETGNETGQDEVECTCNRKPNCERCGGTGIVKSNVTREDAQNLLAELKLRGIGNGAVKKFVKSFKSISKFIKKVVKSSQYVINGLLEMLGYTAIMVPVMNTIALFVGNYDLTLDTFIGNMVSLTIGVTSLLAKQGVNFLFDRLRKIFLKDDNFEFDDTVIKNMDIVDIIDHDVDSTQELIKEQ